MSAISLHLHPLLTGSTCCDSRCTHLVTMYLPIGSFRICWYFINLKINLQRHMSESPTKYFFWGVRDWHDHDENPVSSYRKQTFLATKILKDVPNNVKESYPRPKHHLIQVLGVFSFSILECPSTCKSLVTSGKWKFIYSDFQSWKQNNITYDFFGHKCILEHPKRGFTSFCFL